MALVAVNGLWVAEQPAAMLEATCIQEAARAGGLLQCTVGASKRLVVESPWAQLISERQRC
jgi:hypothetical protein